MADVIDPVPGSGRPILRSWRDKVGVSALIASVGALFVFSVAGLGWVDRGFSDNTFYWAAGRALIARENPYDPKILAKFGEGLFGDRLARFYYPPHSAPLLMLIGAFPQRAAFTFTRVLNVVAVLLLAWMAVVWLQPPREKAAWPIPWLVPIIIILDPWLAKSIWAGTFTPLITAALMGGWMLMERGRTIPAGILLGLASFKPQFALLAFIWMACERRWKVLAVSALTGIVCMAYPVALFGVRGAVGDWLTQISFYQEEWCNAPGWFSVMGLHNLMYAVDVRLPDLKLLMVALVVALWFGRRHFQREDVLGILTALSLTLLPAHDYDVVLLVPMLVSFWRHLSGRPAEAAVALAMLAVLLLPDVIVARLPPLGLHHRCSALTLAFLTWLVWLSVRSRKEPVGERPLESAPSAAA